MDNSMIKSLIIDGSAQACGLITLWGLTNYFDKASDPEIPIYDMKFFGGDMTLTNKFFYRITVVTSAVICVVNLLKVNKEIYKL